MVEKTFEAKVENLDNVLAFMEDELVSHGCAMKLIMPINISLEEMFVNIASYAYAPETGDAIITVDFEGDDVVVVLKDTGIEFDPLAKIDPDINASAEDRDIGGLGIYMVKKYMDECKYERKDGTNIFTMRKNIKNV